MYTLTRTSPVEDTEYVCSGDQAEYTCRASQFGTTGILLTWFIGNVTLPPFTSLATYGDRVGDTRISPHLPGVIANLTEVTDLKLISTLVINLNSAEALPDRIRISCGGIGNVEDYPELFLITTKILPPPQVTYTKEVQVNIT